jgi:prepilin-type N-terminal cleavage/methylation domain-containing protein
MRKCAGFTLLELIVVITLVGIFAGFAAPSLSQWRQQQRFESDAQKTIEIISEVRAMALAEKECEGVVAESWGAKIDSSGTSVWCTQSTSSAILVESFPWESDVSVVLEKVDTLEGTWGNVEPLHISIFPGGIQSRIGDTHAPKWARIKLTSAGAGKESTICFSGIANYPFISSGECDDD